MNEVFKETNNQVDVYTTKYFARAMQKQNLKSLIFTLGAEAPTFQVKKNAPMDQGMKQKEEGK